MMALVEQIVMDKNQERRNLVDAWSAEVIFFGRVMNMLRGLCSRLEVRYPYFETMVFSMAANSSSREVPGVSFPLAPLIPLEAALGLGLALDLARGSSLEEEDS